MGNLVQSLRQMTWVGWLNIIILQWLFFRLAYEYDEDTGRITRFLLIGPVIPMTGWCNNYIFIGKNR